MPAPRAVEQFALLLAGLLSCGNVAGADMIYLRTGERLVGKIITEEPTRVIIQSDALGRIEVPRDHIERVVLEGQPATESGTNAVDTTNAVIVIKPAPTNAPGAKPSQDFLRVYTDHGLRYELVQPLRISDPFFTHTNVYNEQATVRGRFGFKGAFDAAAFASAKGQQHVDPGVEVRTLRFYTAGEFGVTSTNLFKLEMGVSDNQFYLHEAYVRYPHLPYVGNFTFGYVTAPQTMGNVESFGNLTFMETASPVQAFGPGNRMAVQLDRAFFNQRMTASIGFYSVGQDASLNFGDASESLARPILRLTGLPIYQPDGDTPRLLHLGTSFSFVFSDESQIRYQSRPESHLAPVLVDTGNITARQAFVLGEEAAYLVGPFSLVGELVGSFVNPDAGGTFTFWGGYVEAGWFLTGEQRGYDRIAGVPGSLLPKLPFAFKKPGWGALELAARLSYLDLSDGPVNGGRMEIFMPGLNWYWSENARFQFNYGFARVMGGPSPGNLNIFQARLQLIF